MIGKYKDIAGVVLSGGKNSRYGGKQKGLLEVGGKTIIENTISVLEGIFDEVFVIANEAELYRNKINVPVYGDIIKNVGPLGGIHAALSHTTRKSVFIIAADMPFPNETLIRTLVSSYQKTDFQIYISETSKGIEPLHSIYNTSILEKLDAFLQTTGNFSVRSFFPVVNTGFSIVDIELEKSFFNINAPEDLDNILKK
ncbi:MAG: hypothetical protein A2W91_01430 [Bacteroidetes bacterium GWF2_38_335]|nr:MAG: hypothetical protein A2W91_01430 [Bacteroidetes bacterium GWF2_38_335]OFY80940.1 MAG: hypothetical protein A2281_12835 [Bacteroidetes bacterium RIFOXYA12_FULL_38_20]HBS85125.1 hypothetical protein [Bacteroidales bacterium]